MNRTRVRAIFARLRLRAEDARNDRSIEEEIFSTVYIRLRYNKFSSTLSFTRDERERCWIIFLQNISRHLNYREE